MHQSVFIEQNRAALKSMIIQAEHGVEQAEIPEIEETKESKEPKDEEMIATEVA